MFFILSKYKTNNVVLIIKKNIKINILLRKKLNLKKKVNSIGNPNNIQKKKFKIFFSIFWCTVLSNKTGNIIAAAIK